MLVFRFFLNDEIIRLNFNKQIDDILKFGFNYFGFFIVYVFFNPLFASFFYWFNKKYGIYIIILLNILLIIFQVKLNSQIVR